MRWTTLGASLLVGGLWLGSLIVACAEGTDPVFTSGGASGTAGKSQGGSAGTPQGGSAGQGGNPAGGSSGQGGNPSGGSSGQGGNSNGGAGGTSAGGGGTGGGGTGGGHAGEGGGGGSCTAAGKWASVQDVVTLKTPTDTQVWIEGAIATTKKLLVYSNKSKGTCLWGVFVKDPSADYGLMVVSYGDEMETLPDGGPGDCPDSGTDLPATISPGDVLDITGKADAYAPSTCSPAPTKQSQVLACSVVKTGGGAAPAPVDVSNPAELATGNSKYQGLLVRIKNVKAENWYDGGVIDKYGAIKLQGSGLEVHDKFYYRELGGPVYSPGVSFNSIVGVNHLDYCTWVIQPRDKCNDLDPKSEDCN